MINYDPEGKAVLVVEGNEDERKGLAAALRREGYRVFTAADVAHALAIVRFGAAIDVIVTDVLLPMADGWNTLRDSSRFPRIAAIPVVIVTRFDVATPEWVESLDAVACYRKPVVVADLLEGLRRICNASTQGRSPVR